MTIIAHLSDTHFGTEWPEVVEAVQQALVAIKPDIALISGDITQRARPSQFRAAKAFLDALPADLKFVIPGNHDIPLFNMPLRLFDPYHHYRAIFGLREGVWCHGNIGIIGYDATSRWRHTRGKLLEKQLLAHINHARSQLQPGAVLVACAHQPLVVGLPEDRDNILVHADAIARIFSENGVDVVLSGHVHWPLLDTTQAAFPSLTRHFVLSGAGTTVSRRVRPGAPNAFNVIRITGEYGKQTITITLMEYDAEAKQFGVSVKKIFRQSAAGWVLAETKTTKLVNPDAITNYGAPGY